MEEVQKSPQSKNGIKYVILGILILGFIVTFASGYFLSQVLSAEQPVSPPGTNYPSPTRIPFIRTTPVPIDNGQQVQQDTTKFLPGKFYFEDTILVVTKDKPQINLIASINRLEQEKNYSQGTRVSYFDGSSWVRKGVNNTTADSTIVSNSLIKSWNIVIDPSRVLRETVKGEVTINDTPITFKTDILRNEISMRSLPGYTKFMSSGTGQLTLNGKAHEMYVLYTRIYSLNAADIQFYNQPLGLTTDWIAFWDANGNFYHVDTTAVEKVTPIYQSHQVGIQEDSNGSVIKTFSVSVGRDTSNPPSNYTVIMNNPINDTVTFKRTNSLNKSPNASYSWFMSSIEGSVQRADGQTLPGIGVAEYIHD
jgi:hypothetical protein